MAIIPTSSAVLALASLIIVPFSMTLWSSYLQSIPREIRQAGESQQALDSARLTWPELGLRKFDFIIVGAGSAGAIVANRLSANPKYTVLLLDKGGDPNPYSEIPLFYVDTYLSTASAILYRSVPQQNVFKAAAGVSLAPRGKGLGGTGNVNAMLYIRGSPGVFEEWATITGDPTWSYSNVLEYFKKFEDYHGRFQPMNSSVHSTGGELYIERQTFYPTGSYLTAALEEQGYEYHDLNSGPKDKSYMPFEQNKRNGRRVGPYEAFLKPVLLRPNLFISRYSEVTRINLDTKNRAQGVTYVRKGKEYTVTAKNEVVVSAGTFDSPKLLMLSGIGPKEDLQALGIPCKADLPVGRNFQDHLYVQLVAYFNQSVDFVLERDMTSNYIADYTLSGTGPLGAINGGFLQLYRSSSVNTDSNLPDLQYTLPGFFKPQYLEGSTTAYNRGARYDRLNNMVVGLYRPDSVGTVKLASANSSVPPLIDFQYLNDPRDFTRVLDGIQYMIDLYENSEAYKPLNATIKPAPYTNLSQCESLGFRTEAYWRCYIGYSCLTAAHPVRTCPMGAGVSDPAAVVDSKLRVLKVSGLRVIDASVMPTVPNGNTQAPTIMIGELGSSFIRSDYK